MGFPEMVLAQGRRYNSVCVCGRLVGTSGAHVTWKSSGHRNGVDGSWSGIHQGWSGYVHFLVPVVGITVKDVDFVERCGLYFGRLLDLGPLGLFGGLVRRFFRILGCLSHSRPREQSKSAMSLALPLGGILVSCNRQVEAGGMLLGPGGPVSTGVVRGPFASTNNVRLTTLAYDERD